jgi:hypothetical protein
MIHLALSVASFLFLAFVFIVFVALVAPSGKKKEQ